MVNVALSLDGDLHPTRAALLDVGERLIAERGVHGVSLREIGKLAGQRNNSVALYHFGSKEGLVAAIFERRSIGVNARRLAMLEAAELAGRTEVRDLVEAFFVPLVDEIASGNHYVRFLARLSADGDKAILRSASRPELTTAFYRIGRILREGARNPLPGDIFWNRWLMAVDLGTTALAAHASPELAALPLDDLASEVIDGISGLVLASSRLAAARSMGPDR